MLNRQSKKKSAVGFIIVLLLMTFVFHITNEDAFAEPDNEPDLEFFINGNENSGGPLFSSDGDIGNGLWAPGKTEKGTIRIHNNYSEDMIIKNLSLIMKLEKENQGQYAPVKEVRIYENFAKNMRLTIKKGVFLVFTNTLYDLSFYEMLYDDGTIGYEADRSWAYTGFDLDRSDQVIIPRDDFIDLEYAVEMNSNGGNALQGLKATVIFQINSQEKGNNP